MPSVAQFSAQIKSFGSSNSIDDLPWSTMFPNHLSIEGRIPIPTTTKYLEAQKSSSSKRVIAGQIEPSGESQKESFQKLYQYFHDRQRYGVLQFQSKIIKDAYLIPLSPEDSVPSQIESKDSHDIPKIRTEPMLLLVLVILKQAPIETKSPINLSPTQTIVPTISPPNLETTKTYSPPVLPSPTVSTAPAENAPSIESLGLSSADLSALQGLLIAHPDILSNPQILTNPAILQNLIQQHLSGQRW
jgi:hypothetical protein